MKVTIALTVAVFGFVTSSAALEANKKNVRTTHKDDGIVFKDEGKVDVINKIQLEDQAFWGRDMSMSMSHLGDETYGVSEWISFVGISGDIFPAIIIVISKRSFFFSVHHLYSWSTAVRKYKKI